MIPETRYARTVDGFDTAYQVLGEGLPDILMMRCGTYAHAHHMGSGRTLSRWTNSKRVPPAPSSSGRKRGIEPVLGSPRRQRVGEAWRNERFLALAVPRRRGAGVSRIGNINPRDECVHVTEGTLTGESSFRVAGDIEATC